MAARSAVITGRRSAGSASKYASGLEADGFAVIADAPKRVEWHQGRLAEAVASIRGWGEDPADYVTTEIRVPESRFTAWPPRIREVFAPARTVASARPSYTLDQKDPA